MPRVNICAHCGEQWVRRREVYSLDCGHAIHKRCWRNGLECKLCREPLEPAEEAYRNEMIAAYKETVGRPLKLAGPVTAGYRSEIVIDFQLSNTEQLYEALLILSRVLSARLAAAESHDREVRLDARACRDKPGNHRLAVAKRSTFGQPPHPSVFLKRPVVPLERDRLQTARAAALCDQLHAETLGEECLSPSK